MRPIGQSDVRRHNTALVLAEVAAGAGRSRADLAAATGLAKATVSAVVDRLAAGGLVEETGPQERSGGRGRVGVGLRLSASGPHGVGVAIGVDHLTACLVDPLGRVRATRVLARDNRGAGAEAVLAEVAGVVRSLVGVGAPVGGVGVAVPGLVREGVLLSAPNLGWPEVEVVVPGFPVVVRNEANAAALAELSPDGPRDFVMVSGEVGVGAGIVRGGELLTGVHGFAGELGHVCVEPAGPRCACGALGCLETFAGTDSLPAVEAAEAGDAEALATLEQAGAKLGQALSALVNLLDIPTVVLGGDHARLAPWLVPPLVEQLRARAIGARWSELSVCTSALGRQAPALGMARAAVAHVHGDPDAWLRSRQAL
ncbi:ROK family transcriptional regulator [Actinokineospora sp. G85]|uniref:ROK family transcriptional regulator n=1 Tax=Actinokineospora sp. G85 TaxID=3406626 RepID=UPI003C77BD29